MNSALEKHRQKKELLAVRAKLSYYKVLNRKRSSNRHGKNRDIYE